MEEIKQTKLRVPVILTVIWVLSIIPRFYTDISEGYLDILIKQNYVIGMIGILFVCLFMYYSVIGRLILLVKWDDRNKTRDMRKYIQSKIDDKMEEINNNKEEINNNKEELEEMKELLSKYR